MNQGDLIRVVAERAGLNHAEARRAVRAIFGTAPGEGAIADALESDERVVVPGFGTFLPRQRPARTTHDPRSGQRRELPARRVAAFRQGLALKDRLR